MRLATLLIGMILPIAAFAQTTQPAEPEKLTDLFKPYEQRIMARVAELPNVPTQAQMDACKRDCDAIGDEFEQAVKLKYVTFTGFANNNATAYQWFDGTYQSSPREIAAGRTFNIRRPTPFTVSHSKPVTVQPGFAATCEGQVLFCSVDLYIHKDFMGNAPATARTVVAYPLLNVYLNDGNVIPQTAKIP